MNRTSGVLAAGAAYPRGRLRLALAIALSLAALLGGPARSQPSSQKPVEILRDRWGVAHVFAENENHGFYGVGYVTAEDRLLQMDLFRRRATGRLAEVFGEAFVESDRKFRMAGIPRYCIEAAAGLPGEIRGWLTAYATGVNAYMQANPGKVEKRFAALGAPPEPWTESDSLCAWLAVAEVFDSLYDEGPVQQYREFRQLVAEMGEEEALKQKGMMLDDAAAIVPESEMAKDAQTYARLKAMPRTPGYWKRSIPDDMLRFSHAWAAGASRSASGHPLLESDPQTSVNNPPLWYEYHLSAGRFDVRGIGFAGCPAFLIGFNRNVAWGATALGSSSRVTFIEKLAAGGSGYMYRGEILPLERHVETIKVKGARDVVQEVAATRHGFVFTALANQVEPGEAYVSHAAYIQDKGASMRALLGMMAARDWQEFRAAMEHYYSPGLHIVYADGQNVAYQTLVRTPLTRRTPRMALEGWTGEDEVLGRIPLAEMPNMLNPDTGFVSHANNLPVGSWYPYDLGIGTGGTGHTSRSLRLVQLLQGGRRFDLDSFESAVHRDDVNASVSAMLPVARRLAEETGTNTGAVGALLDAVKDWDFHYRASRPGYAAAMALAGTTLTAYRRSPLNSRLGGGEGGVNHLARLLADQYGAGTGTPKDPEVRDYLANWLRTAAETFRAGSSTRPVHPMPYQANGPLGFPSLDARLDLVSPALECTQVGSIWSQTGNSYTHIVDLGNPDNSRSVLPPGVTEDPDSPFYKAQMDLWVKGTTHPAPLTRSKVEEIAASRIALAPVGVLSSGRPGVVNGASFAPESVLSPCAIASLFAPALASSTANAPGNGLPVELAGVQVLVNGTPAPLWHVSPSQINFQAPCELASSAVVSVVAGGQTVVALPMKVVASAPGIFPARSGGGTQGAVLNEDFSANSGANPAAQGSVIQIYTTGLGATLPPISTGAAGASSEPLQRSVAAPRVQIGGLEAEVTYSGAAPGYAGLFQVNARVPRGVPPGNAVPLNMSVGGFRSNTVTIAVKAGT